MELKEKCSALHEALKMVDNPSALTTEEELNVKTFLFREFNRLQEKEDALEERERKCQAVERELERKQRKVETELKSLSEKELFFEKKMQILKNGYDVLEQDRQKLAFERAQLEKEQRMALEDKRSRRAIYREAFERFDLSGGFVYFAGVQNMMELKKRYRDLLKIYHPDNHSGDENTLLMIKKEYDEITLKLQ